MRRIFLLFIAFAFVAISCDNNDDDVEITFPINLTNADIQFDFNKGAFYINSVEQNLNDYKSEIEDLLSSEYGSMKDLFEFDSVTFIDNNLVAFYRYYNSSLLGKYKINNGKVSIIQIKNKEKDIWVEAEKLAHWDYADLSLDKIVLNRTVTKYKGYFYDKSGNIIDSNGDGVINENDFASVTSYLEGQYSVEEIIENQYQNFKANWDIAQADTVLVIPYKLIIE